MMLQLNVIRKTYTVEQFLGEYSTDGAMILNVGCDSTRYGSRCINIDIRRKMAVDCIGDVNSLPFGNSVFDVVILSAVLQYCRNPRDVAREISRVLKPGGFLYVDAPFMQPYCPDGADRYRFTREALLQLFDSLVIEKCAPSIIGAPSLAFYCQAVANAATGNRYLNYLLGTAVSLLVLPFSFLPLGDSDLVAGAFYLIGRKE